MNINRDKHNKYVVNWTPTIPASTADTSTSSSGNNTIIYVSGGGSSSGGETVVPSTEESFAYYSISDGTNTVIQAASIPKDTAYLTLIGDDNINVTVVTESSIPEQEFVSTGTNTGTYKISYLKVVTIPETPVEPEPEEPTDPVTQADEEPTEPVTPEPVTTYPLTITYVSGDKIQTTQFDTLKLYQVTVENDTETKTEVKSIAAADLTIEGDTTGISSISVDVDDIDFNRIELTATSTTEVEGEQITQTTVLLSFDVEILDKNIVYVKSNFNVEQYWKLDKDGNLYTDYNAYSTLELSAYGMGESEGTPTTGAEYLYQLKDVSDAVLTPIDKGILQYNAITSQWEVTDGSNITPDLTGYAKEDWVTQQITNQINILKGNAPENMDTLGEIAGVISSLSDKISSLEILLEWFEWDDTNDAIKALFDLYGVGEISAYGYNTQELPSGAQYLNDLLDVTISNPTNNLILIYNGSQWVNQVLPESGLNESELAQYLTEHNYVQSSALEQYATITLLNLEITNLIGGAPAELDTLGEIATVIQSLQLLLDWFSFVDGKIRANYDLWSVGEVSAYGAGESGETGGKNYLHELEDVSIDISSLVSGLILQYNGTVWVAVDKDEVGLNETELAAYLTRNNYLQEGDITWSNLSGKPTTFNTTITLITDLPDQWEALLTNNPTDYVTRWPAFSEVTDKPTTLEGYGITDAFTKDLADDRYVNVTGDTMTGDLTLPNLEASGYIMIGSAVLSYDATNQALKVATSSGGTMHFYATGEVSAYGFGSGNSELTLSDLDDVTITNLRTNQVLIWNGSAWVNSDPVGGIDEQQLEEYLQQNNYALLSDIPSLTGYATQTWVNNLLDDYVQDISVNDSVYSPNSSGRVTLPDFVTRASVDSDGTQVISTGLRLKDSSNYGLYLYFGDGSYAYIAELTDDDLTIHASDLNLDVDRLLVNGEELLLNIELTTSGSGNIVTNVTANGNALTVTKGFTIETGSTGKLAYYTGAYTIDYYSSSIGSGTRLWYLNAGTPTNSSSTVGSSTSPVYLSSGTITACAYDLSANVNLGTSGRLAYYSSSTTIDDYSSTIGSSTRLWYLSSGTPTNSSSTIGSNYVPVFLSSGMITASSLEFMVNRGVLSDYWTNWNSALTAGMYSLSEWGTNGPSSAGYQFGTVAIFQSGTSSYGGAVSQLYMPHSNTGAGIYAAWRTTYQESSSRWTNWHYLLDTGNYAHFLNNYYVKKSGDSMTGALTIQHTDFGEGLIMYRNNSRDTPVITFRNTSAIFGRIGVGSSDAPYPSEPSFYPGTSTSPELILTSGNYTSTLDSRYVNVTGDTMTGSLDISGAFTAANGFRLSDNHGRFIWDSGTSAAWLQGPSSGNMYLSGLNATSLSSLRIYTNRLMMSGTDTVHYYLGGSIDGVLNYIVFALAYNSGSAIAGSCCFGTFMLHRGSAYEWNGKCEIHVAAGGGYNTNVCGWYKFGGGWAVEGAFKIYYNGKYYLALRTVASSLYYCRFSGWINNNFVPFIVRASSVSSATALTVTSASTIATPGNITAQGEITAYTASDLRLKTDIHKLNAIDVVRKMNVVEYDWNETALQLKADKTIHGYGLIAQELELLVPEAVNRNMFYEGYLGIDYTKLVPFALSAIKEVDDEVTKLKKRVKKLELRLREYEAVDGLIVT